MMSLIQSLGGETANAAQHDWTSVLVALLIALVLLIGFAVVKKVNEWVVRYYARPRQTSTPPSEGNLDLSSRS
jgi:hypothetical protein